LSRDELALIEGLCQRLLALPEIKTRPNGPDHPGGDEDGWVILGAISGRKRPVPDARVWGAIQLDAEWGGRKEMYF